MEMWLTIGMNAAVIVATLWVASIRTTWKLRDMKEQIILSISDHAKEDIIEFSKVRTEIDDTARSFGETVAALKQGFNDLRLECANTYVRREGYYKSQDSLIESIKSFRNELRADLLRVEAKIDTKT